MINFAFALLTLVLSGFAHEGHSVPAGIQAQHGGTVKATHELFVELVQRDKMLLVYPMTHDLKPVQLSDVQISATAEIPRTREKHEVKFTAQKAGTPSEAHFSGSFNAKGAHRYTLEITLRYKGKAEKTVFQVEPRS